jgi:heme a synthase
VNNLSLKPVSPWPHRLAVLLALTTFPLIWIGGLVTTYDAGMAVPDWPGTFGYNLFAYPWTTWLFGPWDLFIEHGHRLLGATVGMMAIGLAAVALLKDDRRWFKELSVAAVLLVILQGGLGGARVLWDERLVAMLHGVTGPAFFALAAALVVLSSRSWRQPEATSPISAALGNNSRWMTGAWWLVGVVYLQLVVGAVMRHIPLWAPPDLFRIAVLFHLGLAGVVLIQTVLLGWRALRSWQSIPWLRLPVVALLVLVTAQLVLGMGTYIAKFAWPAWAEGLTIAATHVTTEKSLHQSLITTAHVANGSLILATTVVLAVRATRLRYLAGGLGGLMTFSGALRAA